MGSNVPLFILGLTGSIGMGKSTVSRFFIANGIPVLDADAVVHKLYSVGGEAVEPIGRAFPGTVCGGAIDRKALSAAVIGNEAAIKLLEGIVHPLVAKQRQQFLAQVVSQGHCLAVLDIPLLYETGMDRQVDAVAVVLAPAELQQQRVLARPGMTPDKFQAIVARQLPDAEKCKRADFIIDTGVSLAETEAHVKALIQALKGRPGRVVHAT